MALIDKVTSWVSMDEASSGVRANSHTTGATYDLSDVNTVPAAVGLKGNAAAFTRGDLDRLINPTLYRWADDVAFLVAVYNVNSDGAAQVRTIASRYGATADREFRFISVPSTPRVQLDVFYASGVFNSLLVSTTGLHSDADPGWDVFAFGRRSSPSAQIWISVNGGALQTAAASGSPYVGGSENFSLSASSNGFTGRLDEFVFCAGGVVEADIAEYYSGGAIVAYGDIAGQVPADPSGLTATATSLHKIALAWTDNSDDEDGFKVERSLDGSTGWTLIHTTAANVTSYTDTNLSSGTTYYYRVVATNANGDSGYTAVVSATVLSDSSYLLKIPPFKHRIRPDSSLRKPKYSVINRRVNHLASHGHLTSFDVDLARLVAARGSDIATVVYDRYRDDVLIENGISLTSHIDATRFAHCQTADSEYPVAPPVDSVDHYIYTITLQNAEVYEYEIFVHGTPVWEGYTDRLYDEESVDLELDTIRFKASTNGVAGITVQPATAPSIVQLVNCSITGSITAGEPVSITGIQVTGPDEEDAYMDLQWTGDEGGAGALGLWKWRIYFRRNP